MRSLCLRSLAMIGFSSLMLTSLSFAQSAKELRGQEGAVYALAVSKNGRVLATGNQAGTASVWDFETRKELLEVPGPGGIATAVALSDDGQWLAVGYSTGAIHLWHVPTGSEKIASLGGHTDAISVLTFSADGRLLASGSWDKSIRLWDATAGKSLGELPSGHLGGVVSLAFSPDGKLLASGGRDRVLRLWDVSSRSEKWSKPDQGSAVWSVAFTADSRGVVSVGGSIDPERLQTDKVAQLIAGEVRLWDASNGQEVARRKAADLACVRGVALLPSGDFITLTDDRKIRMWDKMHTEPKKEIDLGEVGVVAFAVPSDGKRAAVLHVGRKSTVTIWQLGKD